MRCMTISKDYFKGHPPFWEFRRSIVTDPLVPYWYVAGLGKIGPTITCNEERKIRIRRISIIKLLSSRKF